ncbi:unnamed protein product [Lota lota]
MCATLSLMRGPSGTERQRKRPLILTTAVEVQRLEKCCRHDRLAPGCARLRLNRLPTSASMSPSKELI